jgi:heavy metal sensor kinase
MNRRSIRFRLSLWYALILSVTLIVFSASMWLALRASLLHAVDRSLREETGGLTSMIQEHGALPQNRINDEIHEHLALVKNVDLFQIADAQGTWFYRSPSLSDIRFRMSSSSTPGDEVFENLSFHAIPLRILHTTVHVRGGVYRIDVAMSVREQVDSLHEMLWSMTAVIPIILLIAVAGGFWLSRQALVPIGEMIRSARVISEKNLSLRLKVPHSGDELQCLSETLNDMFARLESAFARITQFTADASHELRTPLAFMRTSAEIAVRKDRSSAEYREVLLNIQKELERTSQLVDDLLLLARNDAGTHAPFCCVDFAEVIRDASEQGRILAENHGVHSAQEIPASPMEVEGAPEALRRLCLILIDNAVKYTPAGGSINICAQASSGSVLLKVSDTGAGIADVDLPHIFERFYRADRVRPRAAGTGLGLAIARSIVMMHHGEIRAVNLPDHGAEFQVKLPLHH